MMIVRGTEPPEVSHINQLLEVNQSQGKSYKLNHYSLVLLFCTP